MRFWPCCWRPRPSPIGSGANFTAQSANPTNTFTAGTLIDWQQPGNGTAVFTPPHADEAGRQPVGLVDIQNTGNITGDFVLSATNIVNTPAVPGLTSGLTISVEDCGLFTSSNTAPAGVHAARAPAYPAGLIGLLEAERHLGIGRRRAWAPTGDKHRYKITSRGRTAPRRQDNPLQGANDDVRPDQWDAS